MENIFLFIKATGNTGEGYYHNTLGFFVDESYAKRLADHYNKRITLLNELNELKYEYKEEMTTKFPSPEDDPVHDIPKWSSGIHMNQITTEMRSERDSLKEKNAKIAAKNGKIYAVWQNKINDLVNEWWRENLPDGLDDLETRTLLSWGDGTLYHFKYLPDIKFVVEKLESWKYKDHWIETLNLDIG